MFVASRAIAFPSRSNTLQSEGLHGFSRIAWLMNISLLVQADSTILSFCLQKSHAHPERASGLLKSSSPPHPKKRVIKSVVPVGRGRAQPAPRSFLILGGGACCQAERR